MESGGRHADFRFACAGDGTLSITSFVNLRSALTNGFNLQTTNNPGIGGGTCFGDSGGPNFLTMNGKQILVASTVTGDAVCRSTNVVQRLDTVSAQGFLAFVNAAFGTSIPITC